VGEKGASLAETLRHLAECYTEAAQAVLDDNLTSVVLFGSVARGEAGPESDIDLFIVAERLPKGCFARRGCLEEVRARVEPLLEQLHTQDIWTDFTELIHTQEEAERIRPLYLDMVEDAVILYDREGFFAGVLNRLRDRLRQLGSRRIHIESGWYWDLKPDFKPGEVFEL
jgi:predicted nucleotidyltransferase